MLSTTYGNGFTVSYSYDILGRVTTVKYGSTTAYTYEYDGSGNLTLFRDHINSVDYVYDYSSAGNILAEEQYTTSGVFKEGQYYKYNSYGDVSSSAIIIPGVGSTQYVVSYGYGEGNYSGNQENITNWEIKGTDYWTYNHYDALNRLSEQALVYGHDASAEEAKLYYRNYGYYQTSNGTTSLVGSLSYSDSLSSYSYTYDYDNRGNLISVTKGSQVIVTYEYDKLNQLTREYNKYVEDRK